MKKVVRLSESELTRIIKKVVNEQKSSQDNNKILEKFLLNAAIKEGTPHYYSRWVLDPNNPNKRKGGGSVKLTGKEANINMIYVNKPLVWSLVVNGKKDKNAIFEIFQYDGKLYYQYFGGGLKSEYAKELGPNLNSAIGQFNEHVRSQKPM